MEMSVATDSGIAIQYDPRIYTFVEWADLLCEQYAAQNLQVVYKEEEWKDWGNGLKAIDLFTNQAVPNTDGYSDWRDWAQALLLAVNPKGGFA